LHDLTREPAGDRADQQNDKQTFTRHVHNGFLPVEANLWRLPLAISRTSFSGIEGIVHLFQIRVLKKLLAERLAEIC
jgi:hypothetical protein